MGWVLSMKTLIGVVGRLGTGTRGRVLVMSVDGWISGQLLIDPDVDGHVVMEVFISRDEGVALLILEAHALGPGRASIQAVEILYGCDDRLGVVMRVDLHSHRQARPVLR